MKYRMWAKLVSWGLPCYFFRCCIFIISCYLFGRDCLLFYKDYVTIRCPDMLFSSGYFCYFYYFFLSESVCEYFAMPKYQGSKQAKAVEIVDHPCNLEMCLSFWFVQLRPIVLLGTLSSTLTEGWSFPNSLLGFLVVSWPYKHACLGYAVYLDWKVTWCKGYSSAGL